MTLALKYIGLFMALTFIALINAASLSHSPLALCQTILMMDNSNTDDYSMDCEWYAVDNDGNIGFFTTGGSEFFPQHFLHYNGILREMYDSFLKLTIIGQHIVCVNKWGCIDDWVKKAECGLFGYDYDLNGKCGYQLICVPTIKLKLNILREMIGDMKIARYNGVFGINIINKEELRNWSVMELSKIQNGLTSR